jgi:hypothetical protein
MSWDFCQIVDAEHDDPALYPVMSAQGDVLPIELEPLDGHITRYTATGFQVFSHGGGTQREVVALTDIQLHVLVTEARIIFYCEKWTKSGGWIGFGPGGLAVALTANIISKALAAGRRKGKLLVGHVRYPWLAAAGGMPKENWKTSDQVRLSVYTGNGNASQLLSLDLHFPKGSEPLFIATQIAQHAARYRLAHSAVPPDQVAGFTAIASGPRLLPAGARTFAVHRFPSFHYVHAETAYPTGKDITADEANHKRARGLLLLGY